MTKKAKRDFSRDAEQPHWGAISIVAVVAVVAVSVLYFGLGDRGVGSGHAIGDYCENPAGAAPIMIVDVDRDGVPNVNQDCSMNDCDDNDATITNQCYFAEIQDNAGTNSIILTAERTYVNNTGAIAVLQDSVSAVDREICNNNIDDDGDGLVDEKDCLDQINSVTPVPASSSSLGNIDCGEDKDNDSYSPQVTGCSYMVGIVFDCNDNDPMIYPGAPEVCSDKIDQNCDGYDPLATDIDGDGYTSNPECGTPVDCNDNNPLIYPGAREKCGDRIDQDCNGMDTFCKIEYKTRIPYR